MLPLLGAALAGLVVDPRLITGAPAWMKPAKFAASFVIYCLTLAWIFSYLPGRPRLRALVGWTTAAAFVVEIVIIDLQAWRGTSSHFNIATPLDGTLFAIMGLAILVQTLCSVAVAVVLFREPFADPALGWALRLGLTLSIVAAAVGGQMVRPTAAQLDEARSSGRMLRAGAHTVGAVDGGAGLPVTNWSLDHGDLRVPHFLGLHALQVFPLVAFALLRLGWDPSRRLRVTIVVAASYTSLFCLLLWQALRGQALVGPDATTLVPLTTWAAVTAALLWLMSSAPPARAASAIER
jgi:hypothetical protein